MRIGIAGKGGSGKTSVSWMLLNALAMLGHAPVGVDADYNQHLAAMFGRSNDAIAPLASGKEALVAHVLGTRRDVDAATFRKATRPAAESRLLLLDAEDAFLRSYLHDAGGGVTLLRVGEYAAADIGQRCYHASTGVVDILLHHLAPTSRPLVIDYTAGVDPFASDITVLLDAVVLVVEPTLKGVAVARQWQRLLAGRLPLYLVANKVAQAEDSAWLAEMLAPHPLAAIVESEPQLRRLERGQKVAWSALLPANQAALLSLWQQVAAGGVVQAA